MAKAWMRALAVLVMLAAVVAPAPAAASATVIMTPTTINSALAKLRPGDRLVLQGEFTSRLFFRDRDFGNVTVDGSQAVLHQGIRLRNVQNININNITVSRPGVRTTEIFSVLIESSRHVSVANATIHGPNGTSGTGLRAINSRYITVRDSLFQGMLDGLNLAASPDSLIAHNRFVGGGADGIKLWDNQRVIVSGNSCTNFVVVAGAHPDCIQLWSLAGRPLQSDIFVLNNSAIGDQQAFASFDPKSGSGDRLTFAGNYAITTTAHGVSCYGCSNSLFQDNVISSMPNSPWRAQLLTPGGTNNVFINNQIFDLRGRQGPLESLLPARVWSALVPSIAGLVGSQHDNQRWQAFAPMARASGMVEPVPEPATWLMMMVGFLLIGRSLRRQSRLRTVVA